MSATGNTWSFFANYWGDRLLRHPNANLGIAQVSVFPV